MKTTYETNGWMMFAEEDIFETGCNGKTLYASDRQQFEAESIPELIEKLRTFVGGGDPLPDSCDVIGRLDIQVHEDDEGFATEPDDAWKRGERRLWLSTYTFYIEKVTRETVSLMPV